MTRRRTLLLVLLLCAPLRSAYAQANANAPWALFTARFDTRTSDFIYALYGYGPTFAMVGVLHNPRSDWSEVLVAAGRMFTDDGGNSHALAAGFAQTDRMWYGQVYYVPSVRAGAVNVRATAEFDYPITTGGQTQFALSPISATLPSAGGIEIGAAMDFAAAAGDRSSVAIGPELRIPLPHATLGADLERVTTGNANRLRLFFTTQF